MPVRCSCGTHWVATNSATWSSAAVRTVSRQVSNAGAIDAGEIDAGEVGCFSAITRNSLSLPSTACPSIQDDAPPTRLPGRHMVTVV